MKATDSGGMRSTHFWMTWLPCMLSMQPSTFFSSSAASCGIWSFGAISRSFCTTRQPWASRESRSAWGNSVVSSSFFCSAVPTSSIRCTTRPPTARVERSGVTAMRPATMFLFSSASTSSRLKRDSRNLLTLSSLAVSASLGMTAPIEKPSSGSCSSAAAEGKSSSSFPFFFLTLFVFPTGVSPSDFDDFDLMPALMPDLVLPIAGDDSLPIPGNIGDMPPYMP
mmetsp:Transcript_101617/g.327761  ORF Transcript_101617/g.327761 Transcript_101617/m.327761 type:complete len:224 (+) Transcript_101617:955-1626(+)